MTSLATYNNAFKAIFGYNFKTTISQAIGQFNDEDEFKNYLKENDVEIEKDLTEENINVILDKWPEFFDDWCDEDFEEEFEDIYSREFESFFSLPRRLAGAITDKQSASLENMEILLTLSKFGYVIEFDDKTESVKMTETDDASITVKFSDADGTKCEAKVWGEGKEIEGSYTYEDGYWDWGDRKSVV